MSYPDKPMKHTFPYMSMFAFLFIATIDYTGVVALIFSIGLHYHQHFFYSIRISALRFPQTTINSFNVALQFF